MWPVPSPGDASVPGVVVAPSRVRHGSERGAERWLLADRLQPGLPGAQPFGGEGSWHHLAPSPPAFPVS